MKNYKNYDSAIIGYSDIASLILVGCGEEELLLHDLHFGEDGGYHAYIVDEDAIIGEHYDLECEFENWMKVYDDDGRRCYFRAKKIKVWRAGEFGCIIQLFGEDPDHDAFAHE